jgi:serine/threonine-protein kinase HipA
MSPKTSHRRLPAKPAATTLGRHWQRFARECGLNPKQVLDRLAALAKSAIAEVDAAESEVTAMPAGLHPILNQTRLAVEPRARGLLAQLQEPESLPAAETARGSP